MANSDPETGPMVSPHIAHKKRSSRCPRLSEFFGPRGLPLHCCCCCCIVSPSLQSRGLVPPQANCALCVLCCSCALVLSSVAVKSWRRVSDDATRRHMPRNWPRPRPTLTNSAVVPTGRIGNTWCICGLTPHGRPSGCSCFVPTSASRPGVYLSRVARINVTEQVP